MNTNGRMMTVKRDGLPYEEMGYCPPPNRKLPPVPGQHSNYNTIDRIKNGKWKEVLPTSSAAYTSSKIWSDFLLTDRSSCECSRGHRIRLRRRRPGFESRLKMNFPISIAWTDKNRTDFGCSCKRFEAVTIRLPTFRLYLGDVT
jgi:hypothetical protein